ncbi:MAG: hypothetical protein ABIR56_17300 [Polaromonas sp.]
MIATSAKSPAPPGLFLNDSIISMKLIFHAIARGACGHVFQKMKSIFKEHKKTGTQMLCDAQHLSAGCVCPAGLQIMQPLRYGFTA